MRLFTFTVLCSTAATAAGVGVYPLELPHGDPQLAATAVARLRVEDGPVQAVQASSCAPDEEVCLAAAARRQGLRTIVTAAVDSAGQGYKLHVRAFGTDEKLVGEWRGDGIDLAETLQRGVCASLGERCEAPVAAVPAEALGASYQPSARTQAGLVLFSGGLGLLTAAAGIALYAKVSPASAHPHGTPTADTFALALAATGLGAIGASGLVVALTPSSATLQAKF